MRKVKIFVFATIFTLIVILAVRDVSLRLAQPAQHHTWVIYFVLLALFVTSLKPQFHIPIQYYVTMWGGLFVFLKFLVWFRSPAITPLAILFDTLEILLVTGIVIFAHKARDEIESLGQYAEGIYLPTYNRRIKYYHASQDDIKTEFLRSRRHGHSLSLLDIKVEKNGAREKASPFIVNRSELEIAGIIRIIEQEIRRTDVIIVPEKERYKYYILCPETNGNGAAILAERIRRSMKKHLGCKLHYGIASFPDQVLTDEDLLSISEENLMSNQPTIPITTNREGV